MNSFDFFDTLATRRVARPEQLFDLVERLLPWPGFARLRLKAERRARRRHAPREVTLEQIYAELPDQPQRDTARAEEQRLEAALLAPIPGNLRRLQAGDIVVADHCGGSKPLHFALQLFGARPVPPVHVSSEAGCRKHDGRLWDALALQGLKPEWHIGGHEQGNVRQPQQRGIAIQPYRGAELSRWEQAWAERGLAGGMVAGCARAARLAHQRPDDSAEDSALCEIFGSVVAPALVAFTDHLLDACVERGIARALFLAREGQLLYRVAQQRVRARGLAVETVYLHGSRAALDEALAGSWPAAHAYYASMGLAGEQPLALVDAGWSGEMLAALRRLMEKSGQGAPLHGFSFCLEQRAIAAQSERIEGWAFDPARDHGRNRLAAQRAMVETMLDADEGPTLGFEMRRQRARPLLAPAPDAQTLRRVRLQQGAVLAFVYEWNLAEAATRGLLRMARDDALAVLAQWLYRPRREDVLPFVGLVRDAGAGTAPLPLVTPLAPGAALAQRESWGLWPEGSLALKGATPLAPLLHLVRRLR
jgi:hypothetical protein